MNDRPRRKKAFPKGLPVESDLEAIQRSRLVQQSIEMCSGCYLVSWSENNTRSARQGLQMIRRAYTEPLGFNIIENILLQRSYIID